MSIERDKLIKTYEALSGNGTVFDLVVLLKAKYWNKGVSESGEVSFESSFRIGVTLNGEMMVGTCTSYWHDFNAINFFLLLVDGERHEVLFPAQEIRWEEVV